MKKLSSGLSCLRASRAAVFHKLNRWYSHQGYQEGDIVLLRQKQNASGKAILTKPLRKNAIYPGDANLIVSLLDIHLPAPGEDQPQDGSLEILEAGTGHGALTLHLARAIHGANTSPPQIPSLAQASLKTSKKDLSIEDSEENSGTSGEQNASSNISHLDHQEVRDSFNQWKLSRRAILHTLDLSPKYSKHAERIVRNFRRGIYYGDVDFHIGDLPDWVTAQVASRQGSSSHHTEASMSSGTRTIKPFLSHAILDLPNTHTHLSTVADVLQLNGVLVVFNPSITQIVQCVERIRAERLPLMLDRVVELESGRSEGRTWDVRAVKTRVMERRLQEEGSTETHAAIESNEYGTESGDSGPVSSETEERDGEQSRDLKHQDQEYVMVCRPKVGERITGGGFLGVWRKMNHG
ncbi:MAG: hypothetical protein Q9165_003084 [Trypethelium subeluteriae]